MLPLTRSVAVLKRGQNGDNALHAGIDVRVAAGVVPEFCLCAGVVLLEDVGQTSLGVNRGRKCWAIAPRTGLAEAAELDHHAHVGGLQGLGRRQRRDGDHPGRRRGGRSGRNRR